MSRIIGILVDKGISDKQLADFLGVGAGTIAHWKYNRRSTYLQYINPICEFLGTDPNYLFRGEVELETIDGLNPIENEIVRNYRKASDDGKECVRKMLKLFTKEQLKSK